MLPLVALKTKSAQASPVVPCLLRGTRVLTEKGEIAVEDLEIGDSVVTERGAKPIKWIGKNTYTKTASTWPKGLRPICVERHAIDHKTPNRDLYLSPAHALYLNGVLIPVECLVNGVSIRSTLPRENSVQYFHIELASHEVIYAEGAQVETLLITEAGRERFSNFAEYDRLYGNVAQLPMTPYARICSYCGGRDELEGLFRRMAQPIVDVRDPIQVVYDRLATRCRDLARV
jgi:Hint domain-containing protein